MGDSDGHTSGCEAFEEVVGALDYPMFVVTTSVGDRREGCLVGFASQISISPPRFLVGLSNKNRTYRLAAVAEHLAVHLVPRGVRRLRDCSVRRRETKSTNSLDATGMKALSGCRLSRARRRGSPGPSSNGW